MRAFLCVQGTRVDRANILESVDKSLKRLGTDYIDLLQARTTTRLHRMLCVWVSICIISSHAHACIAQIHWPDRYVPLFGGAPYDASLERADAVPIREQLAALGELVAAGKVRHVGVSNETSYGVTQWVAAAAPAAGLPKIVSIQNSYSLLNRGPFETDLTETCSRSNCNVGLLAYSPLAGGALSGKYVGATPPPNSRFTLFAGYMERFNRSLAREAVAAYAEVARKHGVSPAALALAFVGSRPFVTSTIIGATTLAQLRENIDAFGDATPTLSKEALADVTAVFKRFRDPATDA